MILLVFIISDFPYSTTKYNSKLDKHTVENIFSIILTSGIVLDISNGILFKLSLMNIKDHNQIFILMFIA